MAIYINEEELKKIEKAEKIRESGLIQCEMCGEAVEEEGEIVCKKCEMECINYKIPIKIKVFLLLIGIAIIYSFSYYFKVRG